MATGNAHLGFFSSEAQTLPPEISDLSLRPRTFVRSLSLKTKLTALLVVALLGLGAPSASARKSIQQRHPRLHAIAHAFVSVALPEAGLLPEPDEYMSIDGEKYEIKLAHAHTGEMIDVVYRIGDTYIPQALSQLNNFLRDSHNEEISQFDPRTFDVLHTMLAKVGKANGIIDVLSGYRSQETNDALRASGTTNAAEHSQHIAAKAVDLRVEGVPAPLLRDAAKSLEAGGVGYYPASQFVHVDVGPVREWTYTPHRGGHRGHSHSRRRTRHS
jgi:uncharacterized protein YcbK (DUF882 family)